MDCRLCKVNMATHPNNVASDLAISHNASPHIRWTSARGSEAWTLVESARYQLPIMLKSSLMGTGRYKACSSMNPSAAPWRIRRAAPCLCGLRLRIAFSGIREGSTGLGINAATGIGMAVGSAAEAVFTRSIVTVLVLRKAESHLGGHIPPTLVARVQGITCPIFRPRERKLNV
jgi:hypothetical protein